MSSSVSTCVFIAIIAAMFLMTVYAVPEDPELYEGDVKSAGKIFVLKFKENYNH